MKKLKTLSLLLVVLIVVTTAFSLPGIAEGKRTGTAKSDTDILSDAGTVGEKISNIKIEKIATLPKGTDFSIIGSKYDKYYRLWFKISATVSKENVTGFVLAEKTTPITYIKYNSNFEKNLLNFPESYRATLRELHKVYPNWKFVPEDTYLSFSDAVDCEFCPGKDNLSRKAVELTYEGEKWRDSRAKIEKKVKKNGKTETVISWKPVEEPIDGVVRWTYASRYAIEYFMNPANFLDDTHIFMFLNQCYDSKNQTLSQLRSVVKNTFLEKGYTVSGKLNKDAYLNDIMEAAKQSGISPFIIASMIIVEQGTCLNEKGEVVSSDLTSGTYTYKVTENKKTVTKTDLKGYYNFFNWGATGIDDTAVNTGLKFAKDKKWTTRKKSIVEGAKMYKNDYLDAGQDTYYYMDYNVINKVWYHQYATAIYDAMNKSKRLGNGCKANKNAVLEFKIPVFWDAPDKTAVAKKVKVKYGDINKSGKIDIVDAALMRKHILKIKKLSISKNPEADYNKDGKIDIIDAAAIRKYILKHL